jgi:hypothetical protein
MTSIKNNNMRQLSILLLAVFHFSLFSQSGSGTIVSEAQKQWELNKSKLKSYVVSSVDKVERTFEINAFIVGSEISWRDSLQQGVNLLNNYFKPIGFTFTLCEVAYISDQHYDRIINVDVEAEITTKYNVLSAINVYVAEEVEKAGDTVCSYGYMPADNKDYIFIRKSCVASSALSHEMGRFFGLYETSETVFGDELVDKSNCSTAGDRICETPADPGLSEIGNDCHYRDTIQDGNDDYYLPQVSNIMSNSPSYCRCMLTREQYNKIIEGYQNFKTYLR